MNYYWNKISQKKQINNNQLKFKVSNNEKYKINGIWDIIVYIKKLVIKYLLRFYYLILKKNDLKNNILEHVLII